MDMKKKLFFIALLIGLVFLGWNKILPFTQKQQATYQTAQVEKGTLVKTVSVSGQVTTANNISMTIQVSGVVNNVYVKNGDSVVSGQKIADLTLDQASQQKQAQAWASYLSAQNSLAAATAKMNSLQSSLFKANQAFLNDTGIPNPTDGNKSAPKYIEQNADWLQAEADYKNQTGVISGAQASLNSAALALSQTSATITAPASGVVKGLTITPGAIISLTSSSSNTSTSQVLGSIYQVGPTQAQVNISEIDSVSVSEGQKVTMTLDAFPNSTFTGKVASINTNGIVSSGVTSYPAVITFDAGNDHIYPNMAVNAKIITKIKSDVLLAPSSAVQTNNGQSTVRVMKNNNPESVTVEVGDSNATQIEITSGLTEGDTIVTSAAARTSTTGQTSGQTQSPFSGLGGNRGFGGGFGGGR